MVGLNYDDAWIIIGTGRYIMFMNDEFSQGMCTEDDCRVPSLKTARMSGLEASAVRAIRYAGSWLFIMYV